MNSQAFFEQVKTYHSLSIESEAVWEALLQEKLYAKEESFVSEGQVPRKVAFVVKGLFSQYYTSNEGDIVIKYFFPENRIAGSIGSMLSNTSSVFTITAIERTTVLEYSFAEFRKLTERFPDIAGFYMRYMEQHWIIEKEPYEISLRHDAARVRYDHFLKKYPVLIKRLKKHHIASYLGITPTQLSRIL
ncbi:MAG TPA: Crp/Fnr family transcriptional regulator [Chitinophagaceae bacterium]|jgi:CRP-like cAMP-binding protein|nr:Crp/Fnr family transcriptional regulator [Chitinophagaceae bacterium]